MCCLFFNVSDMKKVLSILMILFLTVSTAMAQGKSISGVEDDPADTLTLRHRGSDRKEEDHEDR